MQLQEIVKVLEGMAEPALALDWDNVGLLVGERTQSVGKVLFTIDLTRAVLTEAQEAGVELIVAYHPPIWDAVKRVVAGEGSCPLLHEVIRSGMAIYALHTALDVVDGGVNDLLARAIGIGEPRPLAEQVYGEGRFAKVIVFVPEPDVERVSEAMFAAGAGCVGRYDRCSFRGRGTGTFRGGPGTQPVIGKRGRFEEVDECRLETIVPRRKLGAVVEAMRAAHSYEEVAYDVVSLLEPPASLGLGRFGDLAEATAVGRMVETVKRALKVKTVGIIGPKRGQVRRAAVGAGSCGTLYREALARGCDFYLTGELKHHQALEIQETGKMTAVCVGHSNSERLALPVMAGKLRRAGKGLDVRVSRKDRDPLLWE